MKVGGGGYTGIFMSVSDCLSICLGLKTSSKQLNILQQNMVKCCIIICWSVIKKLSWCLQGQGHSEGFIIKI